MVVNYLKITHIWNYESTEVKFEEAFSSDNSGY